MDAISFKPELKKAEITEKMTEDNLIDETIKREPVQIISNSCISEGLDGGTLGAIYELTFCSAKIASAAKAGQFVNIYLPGGDKLLPRPFGISDVEKNIVTIVFAVVGAGTDRLSKLKPEMTLDVLGPNGTGFDCLQLKKNVVLVGGGLGVPPLLLAAKQISILKEKRTISVLGYRNEPFYLDNISKYSADTYGVSEGLINLNSLYKDTGNVLDVLKIIEENQALELEDTTVLACGPKPMLVALSEWCKKNNIPSQFSLEERMGCGYGACVGCVCKVKDENGNTERKKVCKDGPVFEGSSIIWE